MCYKMSQRVLSILERAKLVCWFEETNSLAMVARRYRAVFGMELPEPELVRKWHSKFMQTGSVGSLNDRSEPLRSAPAFTNTRATYLTPQDAKLSADQLLAAAGGISTNFSERRL